MDITFTSNEILDRAVPITKRLFEVVEDMNDPVTADDAIKNSVIKRVALKLLITGLEQAHRDLGLTENEWHKAVESVSDAIVSAHAESFNRSAEAEVLREKFAHS